MTTDLETIVKFCRRKGFVFPSSEIYGGFSATYDYGQLGTLLKKNLESLWRHWNVISRTDMLEIEGAIFMHPKVWEASGHIGGFSDLLVEDLVTKKRYRADHLIEDAKIMDNAGSLSPEEVDKIIIENNLKSPDGNPFGNAKKFNLLVKTHLGPIEDDNSVAYLKGESCQNIYLDWKVVQETSRKKLPFGIAQIGKAFRNEITVKQFMFRTREFEQMDIQYFCKPEEADLWYEYWKENRWNFYTKFLGFDEKNLNYRQHELDERAFYAKDAWDIEYNFGAMGFKEIEGVHHRGSYDLDRHSQFSGQELGYLDPETNQRINPFIVECSGGFNRLFLATLFEFYNEEQIQGDDVRIHLDLPFDLAPYKIAVLPLMKKDGLSEKAMQIYTNLRQNGIFADYDESGSIGKRYRRQDENGTPWCLTIDYDSLQDESATLRHRKTMEQTRIPISNLNDFLTETAFIKS
jgi:glycyl-tRNA synthetase